uniref:Uncharacterized protein n=1 Tax=Rhizophagus irregularis (strain DAOM 181602 / DAOM 197198 / MUCL 43194) TaxID=747089 RepID=U9T5S6_RHIID
MSLCHYVLIKVQLCAVRLCFLEYRTGKIPGIILGTTITIVVNSIRIIKISTRLFDRIKNIFEQLERLITPSFFVKNFGFDNLRYCHSAKGSPVEQNSRFTPKSLISRVHILRILRSYGNRFADQPHRYCIRKRKIYELSTALDAYVEFFHYNIKFPIYKYQIASAWAGYVKLHFIHALNFVLKRDIHVNHVPDHNFHYKKLRSYSGVSKSEPAI